MDYRVFLSSCYDKNMKFNREIYRAELLSKFNMSSGKVGINTFLTDFEYGIPENTPENEMIEICVNEVKKSDLFFCILGDRYGHLVDISSLSNETKSMVLSFGYRKKHEKISVLEIEILAAIKYLPHKSEFFLQKMCNRDYDMYRLIDFLKNKGYFFNSFENENQLKELSEIKFCLHSNFPQDIDELNDEIETQRYIARKLRYNVPNNSLLKQINAYVESDNTSCLVLLGDEGAGKSTVLADWIQKNQNRADIKIVSWFSEIDSEILSIILLKMLKATNPDLCDLEYEEDAIFLFRQFVEKPLLGKKIVYVFDGLDTIANNRAFEWLITKLNPSVKVIFTKRKLEPYLFNSRDIICKNVVPISNKHLIYKLFESEGKLLEYKQNQEIFEESCKNWTLKQITYGLQHFFKIIKYIPQTENSRDLVWNKNKIQEYLKHFDSEYGIFQEQQNYIKKVFPTQKLDLGMALLACSERGLTLQELSEILPDKPYIIYHFYFLLQVNEDMYYLPQQIKNEILNNLSPKDENIIRSKIIKYFITVKDDGRSTIELCYQYAISKDIPNLLKLFSFIKNWTVIENNSSIPFSKFKDILTERNWKKIKKIWKNELMSNADLYTETDIYCVYNAMLELNYLQDACDVMSVLLSRQCDNKSLASYHQNIASVLDDIEDIRAIEHIDIALEKIVQSKIVFPQNIIDTYLSAAYIYAHFINLNENWINKKTEVKQKIYNFIEEAIILLETTWSCNDSLMALCYHDVAFTYLQINEFQKAKDYISKALKKETHDSHASDFLLKAQIHLEEFILDSSKDSLILAINAIEKCSEYSDNTLEEAKLYHCWGRILNAQGEPIDALSKIYKCIEIECNNEDIIDFYLTCYHAALFNLNAFEKTKDIFYLKEGKKYAKLALSETYKQSQSKEAQKCRKDIKDLITKLKSKKV